MTSLNGLLLVDKPEGLTSHDVVGRVRQLLGEKKVGHAGTLDPMATGLLVMAVGPSTRLLRFATAQTKRYTGTVQLGAATSTLDRDGEVVATFPVPALTTSVINDVARAMWGEQEQIPPMTSAIKIGGRRLHQLAREGVDVERTPRTITISSFLLSEGPDATKWHFDVTCSVGTYVRVLLSDLAVRLGTLGHLCALRRESSGAHDVKAAWTLENLARAMSDGDVVLQPPRELVDDLPFLEVGDDIVIALRRGQRVDLPASVAGLSELAIVDTSGDLVAVVVPRGEFWKPDLVLGGIG